MAQYQRWQRVINVLLVLLFGFFIAKELAKALADGPGFVDISFAVHNLIFLGVILLRRDHQAVNMRLSHQLVALVAFFSGLAFMDAHTVARLAELNSLLGARIMVPATTLADGIIATSWLLGAGATISLGRSFGILIALREVKTTGAYSIVRHPLYGTDILFRIGVVLKYPYWYNLVILLGSTGCYVYRAILEERFLAQHDDYRQYLQKVRYRFIPGLF